MLPGSPLLLVPGLNRFFTHSVIRSHLFSFQRRKLHHQSQGSHSQQGQQTTAGTFTEAQGSIKTMKTKTKPSIWARIFDFQDSIVSPNVKHQLMDLIKFSGFLYCFDKYVIELTGLLGPSMVPTFNSTGDLVFSLTLYSTFGLPYSRGDIVIAQSPKTRTNTICKRIIALPGDDVILHEYKYLPTLSPFSSVTSDATSASDFSDFSDSSEQVISKVEIKKREEGELIKHQQQQSQQIQQQPEQIQQQYQQQENRKKSKRQPPNLYLQKETKIITIPQGHVWLEGDNPYNSTDSRDYGPVPIALLKGKVLFQLFPFSKFGWAETSDRKKKEVAYTNRRESIKYPTPLPA